MRGGLLAIREERFGVPARDAGAMRVVLGSDLLAVCKAIAIEESIADLCAGPS
ncbi:hypothetical protein GCM10022226_31420 [Sphaerisporangium flaviroseum]|uniref:Uncharacterized protein n=1 Tax=Sphaerisporangium flaviroseum TaxID=509199 RepID=A0ABP7I4P8_9ACTN